MRTTASDNPATGRPWFLVSEDGAYSISQYSRPIAGADPMARGAIEWKWEAWVNGNRPEQREPVHLATGLDSANDAKRVCEQHLAKRSPTEQAALL